jgi:tRNA(fMet)-specific endonuclease VapC
MNYLFDTNNCIALMKNHAKTASKASSIAPSQCFVSAISLYELYTGAAKCARPLNEIRKINLLLEHVRSIPFSDSHATVAATIRANLEIIGKPIGPYDILIAAVGLCESMTVVTRNLNEFQRISSLRVENWFD